MAGRKSDLVQDSRRDCKFDGDLTHHVYHVFDNRARRRRTRIEDVWKRLRELGNGTYGHVWLETCVSGSKKGQLRAVKQIAKDQNTPSPIDYHRELEAMAKFSHENYVHCFVEFHFWFETPDAVFISMEYIEHGDLQKYLNEAVPLPEVREVATQLIEGLKYMHENGFAHRDLKPGNILVLHPRPDWWVKIGDFGISKRAEEGSILKTVIGTKGYLAPEVIGIYPVGDVDAGSQTDASYTFSVDMWALGEIVFRMITGGPAFHDQRSLFNYVVIGDSFPAEPLFDHGVSSICFDFIRRAMARSASQRISSAEAHDHAWLERSRPSSRAESEIHSAADVPEEDQDQIASTTSATSVVGSSSVGDAKDDAASHSPKPFENTANWTTMSSVSAIAQEAIPAVSSNIFTSALSSGRHSVDQHSIRSVSSKVSSTSIPELFKDSWRTPPETPAIITSDMSSNSRQNSPSLKDSRPIDVGELPSPSVLQGSENRLSRDSMAHENPASGLSHSYIPNMDDPMPEIGIYDDDLTPRRTTVLEDDIRTRSVDRADGGKLQSLADHSPGHKPNADLSQSPKPRLSPSPLPPPSLVGISLASPLQRPRSAASTKSTSITKQVDGNVPRPSEVQGSSGESHGTTERKLPRKPITIKQEPAKRSNSTSSLASFSSTKAFDGERNSHAPRYEYERQDTVPVATVSPRASISSVEAVYELERGEQRPSSWTQAQDYSRVEHSDSTSFTLPPPKKEGFFSRLVRRL